MPKRVNCSSWIWHYGKEPRAPAVAAGWALDFRHPGASFPLVKSLLSWSWVVPPLHGAHPRAWACTSTEKTRRRTLQKEDIQAAIQRTDIFDFLVPIICPHAQ